MTDFAAQLREARISAGMSQTKLAAQAGLSASYISLMESASRGMPAKDVLARLAAALHVPLQHFDEAAVVDQSAIDAVMFAESAMSSGDPQAARRALTSIDLTDLYPGTVVRVMHALATASELSGDLSASLSTLRDLIARCRTAGDWREFAKASMSLVATHLELGDLDTAVREGGALADEVIAAGSAGTDEHLRLECTVLWAYYERGDLLYANHFAKKLIEIAEERGSLVGRGSVYWNAGMVAEGRGDDERAVEWTRRALACMSEAGSQRDVARLQMQFGEVLLRLSGPDPIAALEHLTLAGSMLSEVGSVVENARLSIEMGRAHAMLAAADAAESYVRDGIRQLGEVVNVDACSARVVLGDVYMLRGDLEAASHMYEWAADRLSMMNADRAAARVWRALGDRYLASGDRSAAARAFRSGLLSATHTPLPVPSADLVSAPA